ncbi:helix-turn-helix transcriptional regulator [Rhodococcus tibetensis]|uniref:Helix-turn-helix domain-containing protein n=1 Tax=Rhodococcus tibetensis TaxID=2965064 RepID=A0ABT1QFB1_9NOCA|nr:helix-turn-helix domain-containing protein [Rhodococcus sp. FXJ9.536]MCQ4120435.1 helix-turn-helix domain-containing protein [Rhodococcus sp. FXJ9.536]
MTHLRPYNAPTTDEPLLTYEQAGERLGVSAKVVANMTRRGDLPRVVLSPRKHRIVPADLRAFIAARYRCERAG